MGCDIKAFLKAIKKHRIKKEPKKVTILPRLKKETKNLRVQIHYRP